jgi:hypothetical protein
MGNFFLFCGQKSGGEILKSKSSNRPSRNNWYILGHMTSEQSSKYVLLENILLKLTSLSTWSVEINPDRDGEMTDRMNYSSKKWSFLNKLALLT